MRTAGLVLLAFLLPIFAYAALININTADATLLDTLPGIGPSKAAAIVDYRTQHGPFARIEDIQNVSGIGASTYAQIAPLITVGDAPASPPQEASTTAAVASSSGSATPYVPPPTMLSVSVSGSTAALLEVPLKLSAQATLKNGSVDGTALIRWSFGDGSSGEGSTVEKTYRYAGTYLVVVTATDGEAVAHDDLTVTVHPATARIAVVTGEGITLANDSADERLDLSGWRLSADTGSFRIPEGTTILPSASVLFPNTITNLPGALEATLRYPDGIIAARYAPPVPVSIPDVQPPAPAVSYESVQAVEPITSPRTPVQSHEEAVSAPAAVSNEGTAAGAPLLASSSAETAAVGAAPFAHSLLRSPWTLGLAGVMTLAAGAFILL